MKVRYYSSSSSANRTVQVRPAAFPVRRVFYATDFVPSVYRVFRENQTLNYKKKKMKKGSIGNNMLFTIQRVLLSEHTWETFMVSTNVRFEIIVIH